MKSTKTRENFKDKVVFTDTLELSLEELKELLTINPSPKDYTPVESSNIPEKEVKLEPMILPPKGNGSGNYKHKSVVPDEKKELIKKIFTNYPDRTIRTVAKELELTEEQTSYWKKKLVTDVV